MALRSRFFPIDAATGLIKRDQGLAALTATAYVGTQWDQGAAVVTDATCVINVESITTGGATPETYDMIIVGSNTTGRTDGTILAQLTIGSAVAPETVATAAGDWVSIEFKTEKNDLYYQYIDLYLVAAGTAPSIGFSAFLTMDVD